MDTVLAAGATGECPKQLLALARAAGIETLFFPGAGPERLSQDTISASDIQVLHAWAAENGVQVPAEEQYELLGGQAIKGQFITQPIWDLLREKAIAATGLGVDVITPPAPFIQEAPSPPPAPLGVDVITPPAPFIQEAPSPPPAPLQAVPSAIETPAAQEAAPSGRFAESQATQEPTASPAEPAAPPQPDVPVGDSENTPPAVQQEPPA